MQSISPPTHQMVLQLARERGILRAKDLDTVRVSRSALQPLLEQGLLLQLGRGLYQAADIIPNEYQTLIEVARRVPHGVICLLSALRFHEIGTQEPPDVWLCIESQARVPKLDYPPLVIVRQSGRAWTEGIDEHSLPIGQTYVAVRVTSPAKTIADCFKFRNRIGLDIALEALRDGLRQKKVTHQQLWHYGDIDRVSRVMRPYLEAMSTP